MHFWRNKSHFLYLAISGAAMGASWMYLEPLSVLFFSVALLGESLSFLQLVGAVLILGGAAFAELFHQKQLVSLSIRVE